MRFRSLRSRLLVAIGTLVVALTGATLTYVGRLASQAVTERVSADLLKSRPSQPWTEFRAADAALPSR